MKKIDLTTEEIRDIAKAVALYPEIEQVLLFGSRALGNAKTNSALRQHIVDHRQVINTGHFAPKYHPE